jgi:hypothetical protein
MEDNYGTWLLITGLVPVVFMLIGHFSGRKLPVNLRKHRFRCFAAIGLSAMIFSLSFNQPFIYSFSLSNNLPESSMNPPTSVEQLKEFEKQQSQSVYYLKRDVADLKNDLYKVNRYYAGVTQLLSTSIIVMLLLFVIYTKPKEHEEELEEIQQDQIFKL